MTSHPKDLSDELIAVMAESQKVCHHLHLPMQSGSSRILKEMNRRYDKETYLKLVEKIRTAIPDISIPQISLWDFRERRKRIFWKPWMWWIRSALTPPLPLFIPREAEHRLPQRRPGAAGCGKEPL